VPSYCIPTDSALFFASRRVHRQAATGATAGMVRSAQLGMPVLKHDRALDDRACQILRFIPSSMARSTMLHERCRPKMKNGHPHPPLIGT
jgi:hypothetical protein